MKNLLSDERGMFNASIDLILSFLVIIIMYALLIPLLYFIANSLIAIGAPAQTTLYYTNLAVWGMYLFTAAAIIVFYGRVWKKTHDTGKDNIYR